MWADAFPLRSSLFAQRSENWQQCTKAKTTACEPGINWCPTSIGAQSGATFALDADGAGAFHYFFEPPYRRPAAAP
jgi:hypothetical protein